LKIFNPMDPEPQSTAPAKSTDEQPELEQLRAEAATNLAGWQRAKADYANLDRDWRERQQQFMGMAKAAIVLELLPIHDNLQLAVQHLPAERSGEGWAQGFVQVARQLEQLLTQMGLERLPAPVTYDPATHEAVAREGSELPEGSVIREVRPGYRLAGQLIRPSQVAVSSGKLEAESTKSESEITDGPSANDQAPVAN
jgi:molecular chaperone GrpE